MCQSCLQQNSAMDLNIVNISNAHSTMVRDLYLSIEKRLNRKLAASPEYDIQQIVSDFYQDWLRNKDWKVQRERAGKVDIVLYEGNDERVYYEVKTFFKTNERITQKSITKDVNKLALKITNKEVTWSSFLLPPS